jgi:DNA-directed RNA polymerase beta subunit
LSTTDLLEGPAAAANGHFDTGRLSFAKLKEPLPVDDLDLVAIQSSSFDWLRDFGLQEIFNEISPIEDFTGQMALSFSDRGPASAIAPWPTTIGTKSESPGM